MLHDIFPVHYILKKQKDLGEDYDYAFKSSILNARTRFNLKNCIRYKDIIAFYNKVICDNYELRYKVRQKLKSEDDSLIDSFILKNYDFNKWKNTVKNIIIYIIENFEINHDYIDEKDFFKTESTYDRYNKYINYYEYEDEFETFILRSLSSSNDMCEIFGLNEKFPEKYLMKIILDILPDNLFIEYDINVLLDCDYVQENDLLEDKSKKAIVLTEGITDKVYIEKSLELLYPEFSDCFYFMPMDNIESGASYVSKYLIAFDKANIENNFIGIFDNDLIGNIESEKAKKQIVNQNIKILPLNDLEDFNNYPYINIDGEISYTNINFRAVSIELFFPDECIIVNGQLSPIEWTEYRKNEKTYQGHIRDKAEIQKKIDTLFKQIKKKEKNILEINFTKMKKLLETIIYSFNS